jgi:hypothetical protein
MRSKQVKWECVCGKVFPRKWTLYHHIENSHSREALGYLERDIRMDRCFYCDNKPIMEPTIHKHSRMHHMRLAINEFIQYQCVRYS